jgi:hypothetical protein
VADEEKKEDGPVNIPGVDPKLLTFDPVTCAQVMFNPKGTKEMVWMPIGWPYHQAMLFVSAQDAPTLVIDPTKVPFEPSVYSYVCMPLLSNKLQEAIRKEIEERSKGGN